MFHRALRRLTALPSPRLPASYSGLCGLLLSDTFKPDTFSEFLSDLLHMDFSRHLDSCATCKHNVLYRVHPTTDITIGYNSGSVETSTTSQRDHVHAAEELGVGVTCVNKWSQCLECEGLDGLRDREGRG